MLKIKRVYELAGPGDGLRVLVDRLWPRGLSRDKAQIGLWMKEIAPSDALRKWFGHDPVRWEGFRKRYRLELEGKKEMARMLAQKAAAGNVTLLFGAKDAERNQAVVLNEFIAKMMKK
ncbi:MAG: DUF488 family protein [Candidatus Micrarchaeota archaeon]